MTISGNDGGWLYQQAAELHETISKELGNQDAALNKLKKSAKTDNTLLRIMQKAGETLSPKVKEQEKIKSSLAEKENVLRLFLKTDIKDLKEIKSLDKLKEKENIVRISLGAARAQKNNEKIEELSTTQATLRLLIENLEKKENTLTSNQ